MSIILAPGKRSPSSGFFGSHPSSGAQADLVECQVDIVLPAHHLRHQAHVTVVIPVSTVGKGPWRKLAQAIMQPVDGLHGGGRHVL
jgi:hypothetical protein